LFKITDQGVKAPNHFAAGKGLTSKQAMLSMLGEAAERDAVIRREQDRQKFIMNSDGQSIDTISAAEVLVWDFTDDLGSSGCAAHNLMQTAMVNATCELIERRAVMLWWAGSIEALKISELDPLFEPVFERIRASRHGAYEHRLTDLFVLAYPGPVTTVAGRSISQDGDQIAVAFAAALHPVDAAFKAFLELLSVELETSDLQFARLSGEPFERKSPRGLVAARQEAFLTTHQSLFAGEEYLALDSEFDGFELEYLLSFYSMRGMEIMLVDLTRTETGLPACRALFRDQSLQPRFPTGFDLSPM
jgi:ribosomal protein S12 methylthiotransferase accessory factor YcaO